MTTKEPVIYQLEEDKCLNITEVEQYLNVPHAYSQMILRALGRQEEVEGIYHIDNHYYVTHLGLIWYTCALSMHLNQSVWEEKAHLFHLLKNN